MRGFLCFRLSIDKDHSFPGCYSHVSFSKSQPEHFCNRVVYNMALAILIIQWILLPIFGICN